MTQRFTRREWLKRAGAVAIASVMPTPGMAEALPPALQLRPFVDPLFRPQILRPLGLRANAEHGVSGLPYYRVSMRESFCKLHRDLPPTRLWSYGNGPIGPTFEAESGNGILVEWRNELPHRHFLPVDYTLHGSGVDVPESRAVVHLHGGRTPSKNDGYPEHWRPTGQSQVFHYPNQQDAAMLWYHDHAMGISRLNLYAGMMGMYLLRDQAERELKLPSGQHELPLMLADRLLDPHGQLFYPVADDPKAPWVERVEGDILLVNGKIQPYCDVEPRPYRLRVVNASNGHFYRLSFADKTPMVQIGGDQGFLPKPVTRTIVDMAPAERMDLLVDFSSHAGNRVILQEGMLPMMEFRVGRANVAARVVVPALPPVSHLQVSDAARSREHTLNEYDNGAEMAMVMLLNRTPWHMPVTETVTQDSVEMWSFINLTSDTHPIHLHHVRFQVVDRRPFDREFYLRENGQIQYLGEAESAPEYEAGWKDVVSCPSGLVTRVLISFAGSTGRYVWHCHIQEHEANDMMRPFDIVPPGRG